MSYDIMRLDEGIAMLQKIDNRNELQSTLSQYLIDNPENVCELANKFQVAVSTVRRWAGGTARPHPEIADFVVSYIKSLKFPCVGDEIYVPTISDDYNVYFVGGRARVIEIVYGQIIVAEHDNANYKWKNGLDKMQESLEKEFGDQRAYSTGIIPPCPLK
jgi:hypothetical protein